MNIWLFHHYAEPPDGYWVNHHELFREVVAAGHSVTIFTSSFSHWSRQHLRLQPGEMQSEEIIEGIRYVFLRTTPYYDNGRRRYLNFLSYGWRAFWAGLRDKGRPDAVIGSSPHPFCAMAAYIISRIKHASFYFEVHDLWPQFFVEAGAFTEKHPVTIFLRWIERFLLRKARKVFPLWPGMHLYMRELGIPADKIVWMPMGLDLERINACTNLDPTDKVVFLVQYRGRFGLTQDMLQILNAAKLLQDRNAAVTFSIVGEGPERVPLIKLADKLGLKNVKFEDFRPKKDMLRDMGRADVLIGSLPDLPHFRKYGMISSKLLDYLSANRPVIFSTSIPDHVVVKAGAGYIVPPQDAAALASTILELAAQPLPVRIAMGKRGIRYLAEYHDVKMLTKRLLTALK